MNRKLEFSSTVDLLGHKVSSWSEVFVSAHPQVCPAILAFILQERTDEAAGLSLQASPEL